MSDTTKILIRNAREQDIPAVVEIDGEAAAPSGTAEREERAGTFQRQLTVFPNGFIILIADNEIAAYGCSEKWLTMREPGADENPTAKHEPDGRIFCITSMAVKTKYRGRGYRLRILNKLIETAHLEGCRKVVLETGDGQELYLTRGFQAIRSRMDRGASRDLLSLDLETIRRQP